MTTAQVVETSVTINNNSAIQDYVHLDDQTQTTFVFMMLFMLFFPMGVFLYHTLVFGFSITLRYNGPVVFSSARRFLSTSSTKQQDISSHRLRTF